MTNLKRIIDEKGVQQRWLAEQVGVTEVSMSRYVNGERIPKAPMAIRMADVLGVDVKELYGWDDKHVVGEPEQPETHSVCLDTINRQAAIDAINHICPVDTEYDCTLLDRVDVRCVLSDLPSAQPEIIRCKDCKHYNGEDRDICCPLADYAQSKCGADWFCADGERRTDADHD